MVKPQKTWNFSSSAGTQAKYTCRETPKQLRSRKIMFPPEFHMELVPDRIQPTNFDLHFHFQQPNCVLNPAKTHSERHKIDYCGWFKK